jgi:hypothetical protein
MADDTSPVVPPAATEDEKPNVPRIIALAVALLAMTGWLVYTRFINPPQEAFILDSNGVKFYTQLPGIDTSGLSPDQMHAVLAWANHTPCGCGLPQKVNGVDSGKCTMQLAECRNNDRNCRISLRKVGMVVDMVKQGKPVPADGTAPDVGPPPGAPKPTSASPGAATASCCSTTASPSAPKK